MQHLECKTRMGRKIVKTYRWTVPFRVHYSTCRIVAPARLDDQLRSVNKNQLIWQKGWKTRPYLRRITIITGPNVFVRISFHNFRGDRSHIIVNDREFHQRHKNEYRTRWHPYIDSLDVRHGRKWLLWLCILGGYKEVNELRNFHLRSRKLWLPSVSSDVTPNVTRAGIASGFIQNEIHDITTINADGMYVWNKW